jgi:16S rRNA (uracil1498-N3)-methyltransferase
MRRYWHSDFDPQHLVIADDLFHHIYTVCRQDEKEHFELLIGSNKSLTVETIKKEKKKAFIKIIAEKIVPDLPKPHIILALSFPKLSTLENVIEKSVELGVKQIVPFISDFSFFKTTDCLSENKIERLNKIIVSATQQSGRGELLSLSPVLKLENALHEFNQKTNKMGLFAYEGASDTRIRDYLKEKLIEKNSTSVEEFWVFVGSEGGFSSQEVSLFSKNGLKSVSLGNQVLRVETACISLVSILKYEAELKT